MSLLAALGRAMGYPDFDAQCARELRAEADRACVLWVAASMHFPDWDHPSVRAWDAFRREQMAKQGFV